MPDPVIIEVPVSYVNDNVVMESFANTLDVSRAEIQEALQIMVRDVKVTSSDGVNVMVLALPKEPMDFFTANGRDIIVVYAEDPVTNEIEMSFVQKNDNITIKVDESPDGNTTTFVFQDNTGKSLGGITMIQMNDAGKVMITVARINENNDLEILTVKELNPSISEVETLVKELPWPQLPDDLFPILDENNTEVHGSVAVETSDGRIYTEGISGEREIPVDSTDPQDEEIEDYECVEEDCEMDVDEFYNVSGYIAEIMYDAAHYYNSWGVDWYEVRNEKGE